MNYLNPHTHPLDQDVQRTAATAEVLYEIARERSRQDAKWGEQNHPDGTGPAVRWITADTADYVADTARVECQRMASVGRVTWRHILVEEIAEALAEDDPDKLREELIQVAAVAVNWVESIDRRAAGLNTASGAA